jgi:SAM-dependent methyltransferase
VHREQAALLGVRPSPNIWQHPTIYEWENQAFDPDGLVDAAIAALHPLAGARVLDIGCGSGYHLSRYADAGAAVVGLEPHPPLATTAHQRVLSAMAHRATGAWHVPAILIGEAERLPLPEDSVDLVLARWAYFLGPGCTPGLDEVARVVRPGGAAAFLDNDAARSTFGSWFARALPAYDPVAVQRFWQRAGYQSISLDTRLACPDREHFEAILRIEFAAEHADRILAEHPGTSVDYAVTLWWRRH